MVKWKVKEGAGYTVVEFEIEGGVLDRTYLPVVVGSSPEVDPKKGVVLSGRGPIWLFCALAHRYHHTLWVATHDPRLGGAVVIQTHTPELKIGDIVRME